MLPGPIKSVLQLLISFLMMTVFASVVISWLRAFGVRIPYYHPLIRAIEQTYEAMVRPLRRAVPTGGGGLDFAPMIVIILLIILRRLIVQL